MSLRRLVIWGGWLAGASLQAQTDPGWWSSGLIRAETANNYAPLNLGQLMNFADQARIHLDTEAGAAGGAGPEIESMVTGWPSNSPTAYSPANLGQLKAIADKFYARLDALGFDYKTQMVSGQQSAASSWSGTPSRPWSVNGASDSNYALANIGQAKLLFSWDLTRGLLHAVSATLTTDEDTAGTITLCCLGAGTGTATYQIITNPTHGTAVLNGSVVTYYGNTHYNGTDSFTFQATKGGQTNTGTISVVVSPVDDAPLVSVGGGKSVTLPGTLSLTAAIRDIDTAASGITHSWVKVSGPGNVTFGAETVTTSGDTSTVTTTATFSAAGDYVLRLVASDAHSVNSDSLQVRVNPAGASTPTVTMLSLSGLYAPGAVIALQATATAGGGATITKVEFYEGSRKIGETTTPVSAPPSGLYQVSWTPTHWGAYQISAVATTSTNTKGFSSNSVVARVGIGMWFSGTGAGNEGYSGTGGDGGAISGSTTGPGGSYAPETGADGGGSVAGGGGNGTGMNEDDDLDHDGLTLAEEREAGTNPLPGGEDTDGDGVLDGAEAFPTTKDYSPPRTPDYHYAVIDLAELGYDTNYHVYNINNKGQILGYKYTQLPVNTNYTQISRADVEANLWDPKTKQNTNVPVLTFREEMGDENGDYSTLANNYSLLIYYFSMGERHRLLNNLGEVCGVTLGTYDRVRAAWWSKDAGTHTVSDLYLGLSGPGQLDQQYNMSAAYTIGDNGDKFVWLYQAWQVYKTDIGDGRYRYDYATGDGTFLWGAAAPSIFGFYESGGVNQSDFKFSGHVAIGSGGIVSGSGSYPATNYTHNSSLVYNGSISEIQDVSTFVLNNAQAPAGFSIGDVGTSDATITQVAFKKGSNWQKTALSYKPWGSQIKGFLTSVDDSMEAFGSFTDTSNNRAVQMLRNGLPVDINQKVLGWGEVQIVTNSDNGMLAAYAKKLNTAGTPVGESRLVQLVEMDFLDNNNKTYDPKTEALGVSHWVTTEDLPENSAFGDTNPDPQNFRISVGSMKDAPASLDVKLQVYRDGVEVGSAVTYTLTAKSGNMFRSDFIRLVTDDEDFNAAPEQQAIKVKLGDKLKLSYEISSGQTISSEISVGRPMSENNNGSSQKKHDIREIKIRFVSFVGAASAGQIDQEVDTLNERFAQSGIRMKVVGKNTGVALPAEFSNGGFSRGGFTISSPTADESAVLNYLDGDSDSVDFLYVPQLNDGLGNDVRATTYNAIRNATGNTAFKNFVVVGPTRSALSVGHELMHILLNMGHRMTSGGTWLDSDTALFHGTTTKAVDGTKRIGPYKDTAMPQGVGNDDTTTIRNNAEHLP